MGTITVRSIPRGADILIDGKNTGRKTPDEFTLPAGTYTLTVYLPGHAPAHEKIIVEANQSVTVNKTLEKQ
jgi:hypothetical protein